MAAAALLPALAAAAPSLTTAVTVASTALGVFGAFSSASAASSSAKYNAKLAERDALVADQERRAANEKARIASEDKRRENRRVAASIRAQFGASGLSKAGSTLDVLADNAVEFALDERRVEFAGTLDGISAGRASTSSKEEATLSRNRASSSRTAGFFNAGGALLSGAGQLARAA